jgi:hypothetical protein
METQCGLLKKKKKGVSVIETSKLAKYRRWMILVIIYLLTLVPKWLDLFVIETYVNYHEEFYH